jgi:serine/threonine protein kinase
MSTAIATGLLSLLLAGGAGAEATVAVATGRPLQQRFTHAGELGRLQPIALTVAPDGAILVGTLQGVLRFDGQHWTRIVLPGDGLARAFAIGPEGMVYVGGFDHVGRLFADDTGEYRYEDLTGRVMTGPSRDPLGIIWTMGADANGVYVQAERELVYLASGGSVRRWALGPDVRSMSVVGEHVYFRVQGRGFMRFREGAMTLYPGGEVFTDQSLASVLVDGDGLLLVGEHGLYRGDGASLVALAPDARLRAAWQDFVPYAARALPDGTLLVGSLEGRVIHVRRDASLVGSVWTGPQTVMEMAADDEGGAWLATESELVRVAVPSRWSKLDDATGLEGNVSDTVVFDGAVWASTSRGVFRSVDERGDTRFERVEALAPSLEAFDLTVVPAGLVVGHREGAHLRPAGGGADRSLYSAGSSGTFTVQASRFDPDLLYAVDADLRRLRRSNRGLDVVSTIPLGDLSSGGFAEERADALWFGDGRGGPQRWTLDVDGRLLEKRVFGAAEGLVVGAAGTFLHELDRRIYVTSADTTYRLEGERFVVVDVPPFNLTDDLASFVVAESERGTAATSSDGAWFRPAGADAWTSLDVPAEAARSLAYVTVGADGMVRFAGVDGIFQYDPDGFEPSRTPRDVHLRSLVRRRGDDDEARLPLVSGRRIELGADATLGFDIGMTTMMPNAQFRYRIAGLTDVWSEWAPFGGGPVSVVNPGPGDYSLLVEAVDGQGLPAEPYRFDFTVAPQWWQTTTAKIVSAGLAMLLLLFVVQAATRVRAGRILAANRRLELEVAKRTTELERANRELADSNEELRSSRAAVIESGRRADLIFKALNEAMVGMELDGHYRIEQRIGSGGFGTVYRATQLPLGNTVAIKIFKPIPGQDAKRSMDRFKAEGLSAFKVNHPNAVRVLDFGISMESVAYLVMEYLEGESLGDLLGGGAFDADTVAALLLPISDALAHAHEAGVIHRDVKPSNVVVCRDGDEETVKLIDFGIAKVLDESTPAELKNLTATGLLMGTPNYMAPERFVGHDYDGRSDVYSLGVIAYEMLAGTRPFPDVGENYLPMVMQRLKESAPPLHERAPDTPPYLEALVMSMVANAPEHRPTATEVHRALATASSPLTMAHATRALRQAASRRAEAAPDSTRATPSSAMQTGVSRG